MAKATKPKKKTKTAAVAKKKPTAKAPSKSPAKAGGVKGKKPVKAGKKAPTASKPKAKAKVKSAAKVKAKAVKKSPAAKVKTLAKKAVVTATAKKGAVKAKAKKAVTKVKTAAKAVKAKATPTAAKVAAKAKTKTSKTKTKATEAAPRLKKALKSLVEWATHEHHDEPAAKADAPTAPVVHLAVGDEAPDFTLPTDGDDGAEVRLSDYRGEQNVILYFYPKDDTSGCTKQACSFQNHLDQYQGLDAKVVGVSPDNVKSHGKFRAKYDLQFVLAADVGAVVAQSYGVWVPKSMYGRQYMGIQRTTFLIDKTGKIAAIWPKVTVDGHSDDVLATLRSL